MDAPEKLIEDVARRLWFETVDAEGYPNGMMTWDEMMESAKVMVDDENRSFVLSQRRTIRLYLSMALGAIEVVQAAEK